MIITRTPFRISFFGGGTDYPPWYREHGGSVLATTIDKYCYVSCRYLPPFFEYKHRLVYSKTETAHEISEIQHPAVRAIFDYMGVRDGIELHHDGDLPARSGLGSSSSFSVGLINALNALQGRHVSKQELAEKAIHVEQNIIGENVGSQDQTSAAFGGFNRIDFHRDDSLSVSPLICSRETRQALESRLMLFFTGFQRFASEVAKSKIQNFGNRVNELKKMHAMVDQASGILHAERPTLDDFGELLHDAWMYKRELSGSVTNPEIDKIYEAGREAGAIGGKLLGAGGGGFMLFYVDPSQRQNVREKLRHLIHVDFKFESDGSKVIVYEPNR
jgi:D-glycero-alpha-D-manno-heptose-7-phosphate kinase